jgi:hypothetical protein
MVGDPKTLYDLRKIDADLEVTCHTCGHRRTLDREWLIGELLRRKKSVDWSMVQHQLRCTKDGCGSRIVRLRFIPFSGQTEVPEPVTALLAAVEGYVAAIRAMSSGDLNSQRAAGEAGGKLHQATRRVVMWAKYGVGETL